MSSMSTSFGTLGGLPPVGLALGGLDPAWPEIARAASGVSAGQALRGMLGVVSGLGLRWVQLDVTNPVIRPRELDGSARRDLAATLRRNGLSCAGLDLFIPPEHFVNAATADRAVAAVVGAVELASDLREVGGGDGVNVSVVLPVGVPADVERTIGDAAMAAGVRVADCAWPMVERDGESAVEMSVGVGLDPASVLRAGGDPVRLASSLGQRLAAARLSDASSRVGSASCVPGERGGRLDVLAYRVGLMTGGFRGACALDLRGVAARAEGLSGAVELLAGE